jgi:hypothetical protein
MLWWDQNKFYKKRRDTLRGTCVFASGGICGSRIAFQCIRGTKHQRTIFHGRVRPVWISQKAHRDTLRGTCTFASSGICGSHSAFWCVRGVKHRCTIFMLGWDLYIFHKKARRDRLHQTCVLHPVGSVGHVVHSSMSHSACRCVRGVKR